MSFLPNTLLGWLLCLLVILASWMCVAIAIAVRKVSDDEDDDGGSGGDPYNFDPDDPQDWWKKCDEEKKVKK